MVLPPKSNAKTEETPPRMGAQAEAVTADRRERPRQLYGEISRELRRKFQSVVEEPIPDDLLELVKKLEDQFRGGSENDS